MVEALQCVLQADAEKRVEAQEEQPVSLSEQLHQLESRLAELEHIADNQLEELRAAGENPRQIRNTYAPHPERGPVGHGLRAFPELVTVDPLPDHAEVYGEAGRRWPSGGWQCGRWRRRSTSWPGWMRPRDCCDWRSN